MRNYVAKHARTFCRAQTFVDRKKASKYKWDEEMEPPNIF